MKKKSQFIIYFVSKEKFRKVKIGWKYNNDDDDDDKNKKNKKNKGVDRVHIPVVRSGACGGWIAAMNLKRKDLQKPQKNLTKMQIMNSTCLFI